MIGKKELVKRAKKKRNNADFGHSEIVGESREDLTQLASSEITGVTTDGLITGSRSDSWGLPSSPPHSEVLHTPRGLCSRRSVSRQNSQTLQSGNVSGFS